MILGNIDQLALGPFRKNGAFGINSNYVPSSRYSAYFPDTTITSTFNKASFPTGTEPPYSWLLAPKGGELSSTTYLTGTGTISGSLTMGKYMTADLTGTGSLVGALSLITSLIASLNGSGTLSGSLSITLSLAANLLGSGNLAGALSLLIKMQADLTGAGTITADLKGISSMFADIYVNQSTATVNELVAGVWNALAADYNTSGTMGEKMNAAGTAGDPWTTDLTGYNTANTAGKIVKQIKSISQAAL